MKNKNDKKKNKKKKKKRRTGGRPVCVPRRIAGAEPLELSRNAATDTEDEATSAENTAAGPGTAREGDGSPGVRAGRDPRAHGQKQGRGSRGSDRRQRRWKQFRGRSFSHCQLWILPFLSPVMSSLLREEMQRVLFRPAKQRLVEFIEIEEPPQGRHFLCVSVAKNKLVQLSIVQCQVSQTPLKSGSNRSHTQRSSIQECYRRTEIWSLQDLTLVDGRDPDVDDPCFLLHFDKVRTVTAISCSAKYSMVRALVALSDQHCQRSLNLQNFDWAYIKPTSFYSNRGDCVVLSQICFYAFNLVCLSMCPVPLDG